MAKAKAAENEVVTAPGSLVAIAAMRLSRVPEAQRAVRLARAEAALKGKHPRKMDAAVVAALSK
jgi:hypothetical protein